MLGSPLVPTHLWGIRTAVPYVAEALQGRPLHSGATVLLQGGGGPLSTLGA